ncbi:MAG: hypothetical protein K6G48_06925 [Acholeplasmatales bacterium]|nr:hypothetical protein [Acholeplasmatales bacterium]
MPLLLTSYIFNNEIFDMLDKEYEVKRRQSLAHGSTMFKTNKSFLYSNILDILSIEDKYNVSKRLLESLDELEAATYEYILARKFDTQIIQIGLSLIIQKSLYDEIEDLISTYSKEDIRDLDYMVAKKHSVPVTNLAKEFDESFVVEFKEYDFIKFLVNKETSFPLAEKVLERNLNLLSKALKRNRLQQVFHKKNVEFYYNKFSGENINLAPFEAVYNKALNRAYDRAKKYLDYIYLK